MTQVGAKGHGSNQPSISPASGGGGSGGGAGAELDCGLRVDSDDFLFNGGLRDVGIAFLDLDQRV